MLTNLAKSDEFAVDLAESDRLLGLIQPGSRLVKQVRKIIK